MMMIASLLQFSSDQWWIESEGFPPSEIKEWEGQAWSDGEWASERFSWYGECNRTDPTFGSVNGLVVFWPIYVLLN